MAVFGSLVILSLIITACTVETPTTLPETGEGTVSEAVSHGGEIGGYVELVDALRAAGATVDPAGTVSQPFFESEGQVIQVNGSEMQVFEFSNEQERQAAASHISPDGSSIGTTMVTWIDEPHFWAKGRVIALYVGSNEDVINLMSQVMGEPVTDN